MLGRLQSLEFDSAAAVTGLCLPSTNEALQQLPESCRYKVVLVLNSCKVGTESVLKLEDLASFQELQ